MRQSGSRRGALSAHQRQQPRQREAGAEHTHAGPAPRLPDQRGEHGPQRAAQEEAQRTTAGGTAATPAAPGTALPGAQQPGQTLSSQPTGTRDDALAKSARIPVETPSLKGSISLKGGLIDDLTPEIEDFADSAAAIDALDLLVTVDTGPAHLAGALGKPIWLALMFGGEWRYVPGREDNPWYPSMRIFQQTRFGDWNGVIERIGKALEAREGLPPPG